MTYFKKTPPQDSYYSIFQRQEPSAEDLPAEEDFPPEEDERVYSEEDYALAPDGDAFLPDDAEESAYDPFDTAVSPFTYAGSYDTMYNLPEEDEELLEEEEYEELLTEEEQQELRRSTWRLLAGLSDFAGVILGTAAILILLALLVSLLNWLVSDISQTFTLWQKNL